MKEWQELLDYIELYIYVDTKEEVVIPQGPLAKKALAAYKRGRKLLAKNENLGKWEYDIALDCVRCMSEDERKYVRNHLKTSEYHLDYAMWLRNHYVYPSTEHEVYSPDLVSSNVMKKIFSIVSPVYDFRDEIIVGFFESSPVLELTDKYGESQEAVFEEIYGKLAEKGYETYAAAKSDLMEKLRAALGPDEFIEIYREALQESQEYRKDADQENWFWYTHFPACHAMLYPLQANQIGALRKTGLFYLVRGIDLKSREECKKYIDENLGLREDYAEYMARCAWEIHSPLVTGEWKESSLYCLKIAYRDQECLEESGIKNLGKMCEMTFAELKAIPGIGQKTAVQIKKTLESMGLKLKRGSRR